jgi:putative addiction module component (TIGR02574 family)
LVVSPKFAQVRAVALELTEEERIRLAEDLYESVEESDGTPEEIEAAWSEEIADRVEAFERGQVETIDGEEVFRRIRAQYER